MPKIYDIIKRIKEVREKNGLSQASFAQMIGVSQGNVGDWERHRSYPSLTAIGAIIKCFNLSADWLLFGKEVSLPPVNEYIVELIQELTDSEKDDVMKFIEFLSYKRDTQEEEGQKKRPPLKRPRIKPPNGEQASELAPQVKEEDAVYLPLLGNSAAGQPILINEILEGYIPVDKNLIQGKSFIVRAKGDSMMGMGIRDGDMVVIRLQPTVENGEPALVRIGDESTIKYFYRQGDRMVLMSANPKYKPIEVRNLENFSVIGKVVHVIKKEEGQSRLLDFRT